MRLRDPVEFLYLSLMLRWERTAPQDQHEGLLDGKPERNTQISRFAYVLNKVAIGNVDRVFRRLQRETCKRDGTSYVSRDSSRMKEPYPLLEGWFFEGCCNMEQKREFLKHLVGIGVSRGFVECAGDFVEGKSVKRFMPTEEEEDEAIRRYQEREARTNAQQ